MASKSSLHGMLSASLRVRPAPTGSRNNTDETVRVLMYSTVSPTAVSVYPDSDKVGIWVENAEDQLILPRSGATDYFSGEA